MLKLLKYVKKYWYFAILAPTFMFLEVFMDMLLTLFMEKMVDFGVQTGNINNIIKYGLLMLLFLFIGVACGILSGVFTNLTSFKFSNDLRKDVFKKIMHLSYNQTDKFSTGSLVTRVTNDITQVQNLLSMALRMFIRALSFFILGIVFTLNINIEFGYILLIILPIEILVIIIFVKLAFPIFSVIQTKLDKVNTIVHENLTGARVVKAFSKEDYEYSRFKGANDEYTQKNLYVGKISAFLMPILMIIVYIGQIVIYYVGGNSILEASKNALKINDMILVGEISQAITYISMICMSIMMLGMIFTSLARATASAKRINEVLDCEEEIKDGKKDINLEETGTIEFKNVSFKYPGSSSYSLQNISFKANKGDVIAIVGATGSGKSTLVNLITRFYDVSEGEILVDNINVKDYTQKELRNKVAICLQKAELFSGTIKDNIKWGKEDASIEEVDEACSIAQAKEFILSKEKGYDEYVEEKGTSLSGGQKQRLSIARAIIKKPEILIFDDSTSALDLVTEAKLHQAMNEKIKDITKIIVAQRISTARNAKKIIVLDNGQIVGFDTHDNLMKNCEIYIDIYNSQLKKGGN
ncbi:MAG: ABC transporter ATP-binding protein [Bacilli bacterium]|nr:ABC transporter ATP-binding protein [Bacilli bacterium]MDY3889486.1 ABC transporter ATP-binding protein [Bacilli bacterium]